MWPESVPRRPSTLYPSIMRCVGINLTLSRTGTSCQCRTLCSTNRWNPLTRRRTSENRFMSVYSTVEIHAYTSPTTNSHNGARRFDLVRISLDLDRRHFGSHPLGCATRRSQPSFPPIKIFQTIETQRDD